MNQHIGGGVKFDYFIIDYHRRGPKEENQTYDERVLFIYFIFRYIIYFF